MEEDDPRYCVEWDIPDTTVCFPYDSGAASKFTGEFHLRIYDSSMEAYVESDSFKIKG